jgi:formate hydrogenlyase subunit 3/multisubunit Na+/H+ antiporter MnhD subunit
MGPAYGMVAAMDKESKVVRCAALIFVGSLFSTTIFCVGCTMYETNRWGQPQDIVTHLLALGTYFSLIIAFSSVVVIVVDLVVKRSASPRR